MLQENWPTDIRVCYGNSQPKHAKTELCGQTRNLERTSNSSQSTCPTGQVLWEDLLKEVILHITPLHVCSLLHTLLKDKCMCLDE